MHHSLPDRPPNEVRKNRLIYVATVLPAAVAIGGAMAVGLVPLVALALAVVLCAVYWGWPHLTALPNASVGRAVTSIIGGAALVAAAVGSATAVAYVAAVGVLVVYLGEMVRRDGRVRLLSQVIGSYAGGVLGISAALWLSLANLVSGVELGVVWMAGMAVAGGASAFVRGPLVGAAAGIGALLGSGVTLFAFPDIPRWPVIPFAVILGILAWGLEKMTQRMLAQNDVSALVSFALLPLCAMGVVGYTLALVMF